MTNPAGIADSRPSVSLHPAFPAIVALWFAALLGLGSMVLPVALLENFASTTGLSAIIPGAEPPLGFTARGLIALAAAVSGALAGMALARRVAQSHRPLGSTRISRITGSSTPRPINAHEELGGEGLLAGITRRRALSVTDEARRSDFLAHAPLPGADDVASSDHYPVLFERSPEPEPEELASQPVAAALEMAQPKLAGPVDLLDLGEELFSADADGEEPVTVDRYSGNFAIADEAFEVAEMDKEQDLPQSSALPPKSRQAETRPQELGAQQFHSSEFESEDTEMAAPASVPDKAGLPQLVEQLGRSLERRRQALARNATAAVPVAPSAVASAPEIDLEAAHAQALAPELANADLQVARPEEAAQAMAAFFGKPSAIAIPREMPARADLSARADAPAAPASRVRFPAFLSLAEDDGEDGDDVTASFSLPLNTQLAAEAMDELSIAALDDDDNDNDDGADIADADKGFSSLLALNNPYFARTPGFVRVDEVDEDDIPVSGPVVFPGQDDGFRPAATAPAADGPAPRMFDRPGTAPAVSRNAAGEMDDALRSALAKLQRMGGTA